MKEVIISAGIDIGTSTTQLIFSKITMENRASSYSVPKITIVDKEVIYRSDIYFTPLLSQTEIDAKAVREIVENEYKKANIKPCDISTGAVIITGETARKTNANIVLETLSGLAGDFVVATAGPDLESVLSGRGAGTDILSKENYKSIVNIDIGGGTSNVCVFNRGIVKAISCLDIGGRLIKIENGKISYIYKKIHKLAKDNGIDIEVGEIANESKLDKVCDLMAEILAQELNLLKSSENHKYLHTNDGKIIGNNIQIDGVTFSGGVADYIYNDYDENDIFKYGDVGIILGRAIRKSIITKKLEIFRAKETIRATVVGAGTHTTEISGSTISYDEKGLPIKNIPVLKIPIELELGNMANYIKEQLPIYMPENLPEQIAIAFSGEMLTSFDNIQKTANEIILGADIIIKSHYPLIVVIEQDIAKALGNAINVLIDKQVICIDGIITNNGDYIDVGKPLAGGQVIPVVIKTLIFNS